MTIKAGDMTDHPELAPPGAGVPLLQRLYFRYYLAPFVAAKSDWDANLALFSALHGKYMAIIGKMDAVQLTTPVLVPPMAGLEDSSRFWSPVMVLEHLDIVNRAFLDLMSALSRGIVPPGKADTARVKPTGKLPPAEVIASFNAFHRDLPDALATRIADRHARATYLHPWFGQMTVLQWQWLLSAHMAIHLRQLRKMVSLSS